LSKIDFRVTNKLGEDCRKTSFDYPTTLGRTVKSVGDQSVDADSEVKDRKRHLGIDTLGILLAELLTPASIQDRDARRPACSGGLATSS
jgi:putative transposase